MFRTFLCPSSGAFHCTHSNDTCHRDLLTACEQNQDGTSRSCVYSGKTLMMDRGTVRNMQRFIQNKSEKLVHLVVFIIRICHDARSHKRKKIEDGSMRPLACRFPLGHACLRLLIDVCCQVEVYASGRSLVQRSPIRL